MKKLVFTAFAISLFYLLGWPALHAEEPVNTRTIELLQDDAQIHLASRLYELKYAKATDIRRFVEAAVTRYYANSRTDRVAYPAGKRQFLLVTTGEAFLPYVDKLIEALDRGGVEVNGSYIDDTGVTRFSYEPNYRAAPEMLRIVNTLLKTGHGYAYLNSTTNTIYWKDDKIPGNAILGWLKNLDRPLPQVNIRLNYYEVRDSVLKDVGVDYLAWRNGPGLNLFEAAYQGGRVFANEALGVVTNGVTQFTDAVREFSSSWGHGGFFAAPQFDASFVRLLHQNGSARLATSSDLTVVNTPVYEAANASLNVNRIYKAIVSAADLSLTKTQVGVNSAKASSSPEFELDIQNPVICFGGAPEDYDKAGNLPSTPEYYKTVDGGVVFSYQLRSKEVLERSNLGAELGNTVSSSGALTLGFRTEKLLTSFVNDVQVKQTTGIPVLKDLPLVGGIFGTETDLHEKTYIIVTAEAAPVHPDGSTTPHKPLRQVAGNTAK